MQMVLFCLVQVLQDTVKIESKKEKIYKIVYVAQLVECLPRMYEILDFNAHQYLKWSMVAHISNPSI